MKSFVPGPFDPWDARKATHLLQRAGFGGTPQEVEELVQLGFEGAVSRLLDYEKIPEDCPPPDWVTNPPDEMAWSNKVQPKLASLPAMERQRFSQRLREERNRCGQELRQWWLRRMCRTPRPFQEKMVLFWHGHFTSSLADGMSPLKMFHQLELFRRRATGNFKALAHDISRDAVMLRYLDNISNRRKHPNENYARELMELFTMGIGNYTEKDIKESARAFTGWRFRDSEFLFNPFDHDYDEKTFLGRTGKFDGDDIINIIFEQPVTARYMARKLWSFFAYEDPEPALVEELAGVFRDSRYELKPLLRAMFTCEAFYSPRAIGTQIKSPTQLAVGIIRSLKIENPRLSQVTQMMRQMGQDLLAPPSVKGWDGGELWINTTTLFVRYHLTRSLVAGPGDARNSMATPAVGATLGLAELAGAEQVVDRATKLLLPEPLADAPRQDLIDFLNTAPDGSERRFDPQAPGAGKRLQTLVYLLMSSPAYQLC